jgi:hypothetical protein
MKLFFNRPGIVFLFFISVFFSCHKGETIRNTVTGPDSNSPAPVQSSLQGKVVDENNLPVGGAIVKLGNKTTTTDFRGLFFLMNAEFDQYSSLVSIEKTGYFKGLRNFSTKAGAYNFIQVKLLRKQLVGTINSATGGTVTLPDNSAITINAGSTVIKSSNQPYTGSIKIYAAGIDPASNDMAQILPGSLLSLDSVNRRVVLQSFGMMAVELEGSSNESLQIATGKTAKLKVKIPVSLQAAAPAAIPMWSLNETTGLWKQEGTGVKNSSYYEGDVSHFSFWNYDLNSNAIFLELTLKDAQGLPLPHTKVRLTRVNSPASVYGYTDTSGYTSGYIFKNESLRLDVLNTCDQVIYTKNLGQLTQNTNLGIITVTLPAQYTFKITGTVVNCNNQPVTRGSALIYLEGKLYESAVTNGSFSFTSTQCPGTAVIEVVALDSAANQMSNTYSFAQSPLGTSVNTGVLNACGVSAASTLDYTYDGKTYSLSTAEGDTLSSGNYVPNGTGFPFIVAVSRSDPANVYISVEYDARVVAPGTYPVVNLGFGHAGPSYQSSTPFDVIITKWGAVGQFMEGTINGVFFEPGPKYHYLTGNFRIKRVR